MSLFDRFFFSADLGDGGGAGGAVAAPAGDVGSEGVDGGVGEQQAAPFDYEALAQRYGGPEGLQEALKRHDDIAGRYHYNPQFKDTLDRALRGEFGPQAQAEAKAQQQGQQGQQGQQPPQQTWLKYDPTVSVQMQTFHAHLQRAKESGDPQAVQDVWNDPTFAQARDAYQAHQNEMNGSYWDPRGFQTKMFNDPEMQEMRQKEMNAAIEQAMAPLRQELAMHQKTAFYNQNKQAIDSLPDHIKEAFKNGVFGPYDSGPDWIAAATAAMESASKLAANPPQKAAAPQAGQQPPQQNGYRPATNGVNRMNQPKEAAVSPAKQYAAQMRKDREKDRAAEKS